MSDPGDDNRITSGGISPGGVRDDVKRLILWLVLFGAVGGAALALLILKLIGEL